MEFLLQRNVANVVLIAENKTTIVISKSGSPRVIFSLYIRRRPLYYIVNLIIPCCLLSFVAVITFVLPPDCSERLGLSTYAMCMCL